MPALAILPLVLSKALAAISGAFVYWLALLIDSVLPLSAVGAAGLLLIVMVNDLLLLCDMLPGLPCTVKLAVLVPVLA